MAAPPSGRFVSVSAGYYYTCGIRTDDTVECWGWNESGQATPLAGRFVSVSAGYAHTCGMRVDYTIQCWGWNEYGQATPPSTAVVVPGADRDEPVNDGQATPPRRFFTSVSAGYAHTCGARNDGTLACWGIWYDLTTPPAGFFTAVAGTFTAVSAGGLHNCGVRTDGSLACWDVSANGDGRTTPPGGQFIAVSAGGFHTCGVRTDAPWPAGA